MRRRHGWIFLGLGVAMLASLVVFPLMAACIDRWMGDQIGGEEQVSAPLTTESRSQSGLTEATVLLDVPYIGQKGVLPTGCELVSAAMLLRYYGYDTSLDELVDRYLDKQPLVRKGDQLVGPHPAAAFVGDPRCEDGYGCYAPVIARLLGRVLDTGRHAALYEGKDLAWLERHCLDEGRPVLLWVSIGMRETGPGTTWTVGETGEAFTWTKPEHCMVLVGYDDTNYFFNDPYNNNGLVRYPKALVKARYQAFGCQAVAVES